MVLCKCGCGQEVKEGNIYVHGHNRGGLPSNVVPDGKWSRKYDCCIECGTTERKYVGKGLCTKCHRAVRYKVKKNGDFKKWSRKYDRCIDCGRTDRPHQANGRCGTCHGNNLNRIKGVRKKNVGAWAWYYDKCRECGTTDRPHASHGLCYDCYEASKRDLSSGYEICPVCYAKVKSLNQHLSMRSKKCDEHFNYLRGVYKIYFESDFGLNEIAEELKSERHVITRNFIRFFGKEETTKRNQAVKSCIVSARAKIGFNHKNKFGTITYYESVNNGNVRFRSKLEKQFAEFLDKSGTKWAYEQKSFPYIDKNGKRRTYTPDFYLVETDEYIEIKAFDKGDADYKIDAMKKIGLNIRIIRQADLKKEIKNEQQ
jgi:hypothetical protein